MTENKKQKLIEKFKEGKCNEAELQLLRNVSETDDAIRRLLDFGGNILDNQMLSDAEVKRQVQALNKASRASGRRESM